MPRRHSQNNTAGAIFTHYEKTQLKEYGTQKQRLTRDNLKPFDACTICLQPVVIPMADRSGSIYCKQCIYQYLLDQKKLFKKQLKEYKAQEKEEKIEKISKQKEEENARIESFMLREKGIIADSSSTKKKDSINNFWLPDAAPKHVPNKIKKPSKVILSPNGHPIKLKDLVPLNLKPVPMEDDKNNKNTTSTSTSTSTTTTTSSNNSNNNKKNNNSNNITTGRYMCPTCTKLLNNVTGVVCITVTGNVFCSSCMENVLKKEMVCPISNMAFEEDDILTLQSEGSSFSARTGKKLEAVKQTPAPRL